MQTLPNNRENICGQVLTDIRTCWKWQLYFGALGGGVTGGTEDGSGRDPDALACGREADRGSVLVTQLFIYHAKKLTVNNQPVASTHVSPSWWSEGSSLPLCHPKHPTPTLFLSMFQYSHTISLIPSLQPPRFYSVLYRGAPWHTQSFHPCLLYFLLILTSNRQPAF